ncbi:MAG: DUF2784 domain-containing protein [Rudaea sp.]
MGYRLAADAVVLLHLGFIVFALAGGLLASRWPAVALVHVPAMAWAAFVELAGRLCPLTTFENRLRAAAGARGYGGGFVEHYVIGIVYPAGLTRQHELVLAAIVVIVNALVYGWLWRRWRAGRRREESRPFA